jgi:hypothetical protein
MPCAIFSFGKQSLAKLTPNIDFIHTFFWRFLTFFLANSDWQIGSLQRRQILGHKFGKCGCAVWGRMLIKWNGKFLPNTVRRRLFVWQTKLGEIDHCWHVMHLCMKQSKH